jgi:thiol:disulfide interchange protein DsbD
MTKPQNNWIWILGTILLVIGVFYVFSSLEEGPKEKSKISVWRPYSASKFQEAISQHQPVIIDFFAQWCAGCHELDKEVLSRADIPHQLSQVMAFRVDATDINATSVNKAIDQYGVVGIPTIVFLDASGHEIKECRIEGVVSIKQFERSLQTWMQRTGVHVS